MEVLLNLWLLKQTQADTLRWTLNHTYTVARGRSATVVPTMTNALQMMELGMNFQYQVRHITIEGCYYSNNSCISSL